MTAHSPPPPPLLAAPPPPQPKECACTNASDYAELNPPWWILKSNNLLGGIFDAHKPNSGTRVASDFELLCMEIGAG